MSEDTIRLIEEMNSILNPLKQQLAQIMLDGKKLTELIKEDAELEYYSSLDYTRNILLSLNSQINERLLFKSIIDIHSKYLERVLKSVGFSYKPPSVEKEVELELLMEKKKEATHPKNMPAPPEPTPTSMPAEDKKAYIDLVKKRIQEILVLENTDEVKAKNKYFYLVKLMPKNPFIEEKRRIISSVISNSNLDDSKYDGKSVPVKKIKHEEEEDDDDEEEYE